MARVTVGAGRVAVTEPIGDSLMAVLATLPDTEVVLFLDGAHVAATEILIGLPAALQQGFESENREESLLPVSHKYLYYQDLESWPFY